MVKSKTAEKSFLFSPVIQTRSQKLTVPKLSNSSFMGKFTKNTQINTDIAKEKVKQVKNVSVSTNECLTNTLDLLQNNWVSDDSIQTYFNILSSKVIHQNVFILSPSVIQTVQYLNDIDHLLKPLSLETREFVFFPINDCPKIYGIGGTHWSLMVYSRIEKCYFYLDSIGTYNYKFAQSIAEKVNTFIDPHKNYKISIKTIETPQQNNSRDCGIYMVLFMDILLSHILNGTFKNLETSFTQRLPIIKDSDILTKRAHLALFINIDWSSLSRDTIISMMCHCFVLDESSTTHPKLLKSKDLEEDACLPFPTQSYFKTIGENTGEIAVKVRNVNQTSAQEKNVYHPNVTTYNRFAILSQEKDEVLTNGINTLITKIKTPEKKNTTYIENTIKTKDGKRYELMNSNRKSVKANNNASSNVRNVEKSNPQSSNDLSRTNRSKITLLTDSHGRFLRQNIFNNFSDNYEVSALLRPNGKVCHILSDVPSESISLNHKDFIFIMAGTNDIHKKTNLTLLVEEFEKTIKLCGNTNLILSAVPYRYDAPFLNSKIMHLNKLLENLANKYSYVHFLQLNELNRECYTSHGLHMNSLGKIKLTSMLHSLMQFILNDGKHLIPVRITSTLSHDTFSSKPTFLEKILVFKKNY